MEKRLVISGCGVISALGLGKSASLQALRDGHSGVGPVKFLHGIPEALPAGEVPYSNAELAAMAGAPESAATQYPRTSLLAILALKEALSEAGVKLKDIPIVSGTTVGGMDLTEKIFPRCSEYHSCGASTRIAADFLGGAKFSTTISTACSSSANALVYSANLIRCGKFDCVVCGGSESLSRYHFHGFNSLMILDGSPCRPFDAQRRGLNLGEGAAFLVLETEENAKKRGVKPLAVLSGYGNACDAFHQTASSENGEGAFLAIQKALSLAGLEASAIDYVNAHGTGTPNNDASESAALRRIFKDSLPPVSSTKPFTGHTTSASGSIEAVFCILAILNGFIPRQLNWSEEDPSCVIPYTGESLGVSLKNVICNAFGFGGNDSSIILSAYDA